MKYDISICFPSIRVHLLDNVYESLVSSCGTKSWELIIVGPYRPSEQLLEKPNFKFIEDWGHPTRCCQIGSQSCSGKYFTWGADDAIWLPNALEKCCNYLLESDAKLLAIKYLEKSASGHSDMEDVWYTAYTHRDLRLGGIDRNWKIAPVGMLELELFKQIGGFDCSFEHLNFSCHDLAFRLQKYNHKVDLSPFIVFECAWSNTAEDHGPIHESHFEHDLPSFQKLYESPNDRYVLDYQNWTAQENVWRRRFKNGR